MTLARTDLLGQVSGASGTFGTGAFVTSSFTPPDNSLLVVCVGFIENGGSTSPLPDLTISGGGLTYTARASAAIDDGAGSFYTAARIYTAPVATGASMTLTLDCAARSIGEYSVSVVAYTGYDVTSPTGTFGANGANSGFGSPPNPVSLTTGVPAATSEVFAGVSIQKDVAGCTPGATFTELHDVENTSWGGLESEIRTNSVSTTVDWVDVRDGGGALFAWVGVAIEIKAAAAAGGPVMLLPPPLLFELLGAAAQRYVEPGPELPPAYERGHDPPLPPPLLFELLGAAAQRYHDEPAAMAGGTPETGTGSMGLSGHGTAVKVAVQTGRCAIGLAGTASPVKVAPETGTSSVGLVARAVAEHIAPRAGVGSVGLASTGAARKVTAQTSTGVLGLAGYGPTQQARPQTGRAAIGLTAHAAAVHVALPAGRGALGVAGSATQVKRATPTGTAQLGLAARAVVVKRATPQSTAHIGLAGRVAVVKRATPVGSTVLALAGRGTSGHIAPRTGVAALGLAAYATARKLATLTGRGMLGLTGHGTVTPIVTNPITISMDGTAAGGTVDGQPATPAVDQQTSTTTAIDGGPTGAAMDGTTRVTGSMS